MLSSDESETNVDKVVDDVCYVGDEDDSDDVMQVSFSRERGQWALYYTSPQSFMLTFSYMLA